MCFYYSVNVGAFQQGQAVQVFDLDSKAVHYESGVLNEIENSTFFSSK